jgi:hypothetical protein
MIRRAAWTCAFAFVGILSVFTWASIDERLCRVYPTLCIPRPGECGGGLDACPANAHVMLDLAAYMFLPVALFAALGLLLSGRKRGAVSTGVSLALAIFVHWTLTFIGVRVLHV